MILLLLPPEDVREVPEVRKLPQSADLPEEVSAVTAGRLPGVWRSHAVAPVQDGRPAVALRPGVPQPAPPRADAFPLCRPSLYRPLQVGGWSSVLEGLFMQSQRLQLLFYKTKTTRSLFRMRFLVKRWHKATGMSSTTSCTVNKNGAGQTLGDQNIFF